MNRVEILNELRRFRNREYEDNKLFTEDIMKSKNKPIIKIALLNFPNILDIEKDKEFIDELNSLYLEKFGDNKKMRKIDLFTALRANVETFILINVSSKKIEEKILDYYTYFLKTADEEIIVREFGNAFYLEKTMQKYLMGE